MRDGHDLIDAYLDELLVELRSAPRLARRALAEAEDHLREGAAEAGAAGASPEDAQRVAIERFGSPRLVARRFRRAGEDVSVFARSGVAALQVVGFGLTAIGFSGVVVFAMLLLLGPSYVMGYTVRPAGPSGLCQDLLQMYPSAPSCASAFQESVLGDDVVWRLVPGAVGIAVLGVLWLVSRRWIGRRLLLPSRSSAWILIVAGIVVATSLATGQDPGIGDHLATTLSALATIVACALSLRARPRLWALGTAST
jgi:hypothetical protein